MLPSVCQLRILTATNTTLPFIIPTSFRFKCNMSQNKTLDPFPPIQICFSSVIGLVYGTTIQPKMFARGTGLRVTPEFFLYFFHVEYLI